MRAETLTLCADVGPCCEVLLFQCRSTQGSYEEGLCHGAPFLLSFRCFLQVMLLVFRIVVGLLAVRRMVVFPILWSVFATGMCWRLKTKWKYFSIQRSPISRRALFFERFPGLAHLYFWWKQHVDDGDFGTLVENRSTRRKPCPFTTLSTINLTYTKPKSNSALRGG